ncbi:hypothetical protein ACFYMW_35980 [Streptomyces sp. NPDC006692]|uniref:hypothetical protein n=1 Tax=unclassified Streptomyces TaxID=2593676 RepID=UPI00342CBB06
MIHHTPEAVRAEMQERLRVARRQREIAAAAAERRRIRRAERANRPSRLRRTIGVLRRTAQALRRAAAHSLRSSNSRKA